VQASRIIIKKSPQNLTRRFFLKLSYFFLSKHYCTLISRYHIIYDRSKWLNLPFVIQKFVRCIGKCKKWKKETCIIKYTIKNMGTWSTLKNSFRGVLFQNLAYDSLLSKGVNPLVLWMIAFYLEVNPLVSRMIAFYLEVNPLVSRMIAFYPDVNHLVSRMIACRPEMNPIGSHTKASSQAIQSMSSNTIHLSAQCQLHRFPKLNLCIEPQ
jgi:hypothetical protein